MNNTVYSQEYHALDPIRTPLSGSYYNTIKSPSSNNSQNFKNRYPTKKEQLRQINSIMRQKINYMTNQFSTIQKSFVQNTGLSKTVGQDLLVQTENSPQHKKFKNTISTQLDRINFDQIQSEQSFLRYDSCILSQKRIKQKILNAYELIQQYQNANQDHKLNIQLQEYGKFYETKCLQLKQYPEKQYYDKRYLQSSQFIKTKQYLKPSYISYTDDEFPSERMIQEKVQLKDNNQSNHQRVVISNYNILAKQKSKNKVDKAIYKAIQDRIVTSGCTFNAIPMNKEKNKVENIIARMNRQTIEREGLIDQLRRSHKKK